VEPVASGRDADLFDAGPGRLLRRTRDGRSLEREAKVMTYARDHGYPVPEVYELRDGDRELVMERVDGPLMLDALLPGIWRLNHYADMLADLHDQLHEISAPDGLAQLPDGGDRLVHLDLHPLNVILSSRGPVVIDWPNAARGEARSDAALTYVLLTCPRVPGSRAMQVAANVVRRRFAARFARRFVDEQWYPRLAEIAELRALDRNVFPDEVEAMLRLSARARDHRM
jgi:tRNA A-37 threonylcarbamoyl transferase component Bud32